MYYKIYTGKFGTIFAVLMLMYATSYHYYVTYKYLTIGIRLDAHL